MVETNTVKQALREALFKNNRELPYTIKMKGIIDYLIYRYRKIGFKNFFEFKNGYPQCLATAYCSHRDKEIVCIKYVPESTIIHEIGHELGYDHRSEREHVMFPRINRGMVGSANIKLEYAEKYGLAAYRKLRGIINDR